MFAYFLASELKRKFHERGPQIRLVVDRRPLEMLTSDDLVSTSLTWLGPLTTDDKIVLRNLKDHFETESGELTSELFSTVSCSDFQMVVNELSTNNY